MLKNKITIKDIQKFKNQLKPFATITAYDYISALKADMVDIPLILVGDSAAMVVYGMDTTIPISMDELIFLVRAVSRGNKKALIVADMPFMSYQASIEDAVRNAGRFIKEGGAEAIKLEGGAVYENQIKAIIDAGIPVVGHIGLLPQSYHLSSGYRLQGKTQFEADKIFNDAIVIQNSGAFAIVLEGIPDDLADKITQNLKIPTIGIGAGPYCDGQIQVFHDIMGLNSKTPPKHSKCYGNLGNEMQQILSKYKIDVEENRFPKQRHHNSSQIVNTKKQK